MQSSKSKSCSDPKIVVNDNSGLTGSDLKSDRFEALGDEDEGYFVMDDKSLTQSKSHHRISGFRSELIWSSKSLVLLSLIDSFPEFNLHDRLPYDKIEIFRWRYRKIRGDLICQSSHRDYPDRTIFSWVIVFQFFTVRVAISWMLKIVRISNRNSWYGSLIWYFIELSVDSAIRR